MGKLRKLGKKIWKGVKSLFKNPGRALKKGLGEVGKAFGELGPIGTLALTLMFPGMGSVWQSFGSWANSFSGPLGHVMKGIHTAGNAIGTISKSVGDALSGVLNKVSGGQWDNLTSWVGDRMDSFRTKIGLPTSQHATITKHADDMAALKDESFVVKWDEDVGMFKKKYGADIIKPPTLIDSKINIKDTTSLLREPVGALTETPRIDAKSLGLDFEISAGKPDLAALQAQTISGGQTTKVPIGYKFNRQYVGVNDVPIVSVEPEYTDVASHKLTAADIKRSERITSNWNAINTRSKNLLNIADKTDNFTFSDVMSYDARGVSKVAGAAGVLETGIGQDDPQFPNLAAEITPLPTEVTTSNDYTRYFGNQYQMAGYNGPMTLDGFAQAGFYGGDPYSFNQILRANRLQQLTPTITLNS